MSEPRLALERLLLVRADDGAAFTGGDAVEARNVQITPIQGDELLREKVKHHFGNDTSKVTRKHVAISYEIDLSIGVAGVAQPWGPHLRACGFAETLRAERAAAGAIPRLPARTRYSPVTGQGTKIKIGYIMDDVLHTLGGCQGSVELALVANQWPVLRLNMIGSYDDPTAAPNLAADFSGYPAANEVSDLNTPVVSVFGVNDLALRELTANMNITTVWDAPVNRAAQALLTNRAPSANLVVDQGDLATFNPTQLAADKTTGVVTATHGMAAGPSQLKLTMPLCEIGNDVSYQDADGISQMSMSLRPLPSDAGNDEVIIDVEAV